MTIELLKEYSADELTGSGSHDWEKIEATFGHTPRVFENTLFRLHFRRKKLFTLSQRENIRRFLLTGYEASGDVRYFNELLWFCDDTASSTEFRKHALAIFEKKVDARGVHPFPLATPQDVRMFLDRHKHPAPQKVNTSLKVGLVGFPAFFGSMSKQLRNLGFDVKQIFIPFHPNRKVNKLLSIAPLVKGISLLRQNFSQYRTLNYHYKDPRIGEHLAKEEFDIGFHKLNFIIKNNVFDHFRKGLINDHWAVLPHLRGKSTIAWTLLHGFPMVCTLHLIDHGVDTGKIIAYYEYDVAGISTIDGVRNKVRSTLTERIVDGIKRLSVDDFSFIENRPHGGLTYYEIHPWLYQHVEKSLARR